MGFNYAGDSDNLNGRLFNSYFGRRAPRPGTTKILSGTTVHSTGQLSGNTVYVLVGTESFHIASDNHDLLTASNADMYWPANEPFYHEAKTGISDYVSITSETGNVEVYISPLKE